MKIPGTINQLAPNQSFVLFDGNMHFKCEDWDLNANAIVEFNWIPEPNITVVAPLEGRLNMFDFKNDIRLCIELTDGSGVIPLYMKSLRNDSINATTPCYIEGNVDGEVNLIRFEVPNLFTFHGDADTPINTLVLKANGYSIFIQSESYFHLKYHSLDGGYISNGRGEVKSISKPLVFSELQSTFKLLNKFLSFIHGRRVDSMFFEGFIDDNRQFKYYPVRRIDENDVPWTWFTLTLNLKDNHFIESMWERMYQVYQSEEGKDFLDLLMHFYSEATYNRNSGETSITIIQNALELLSSKILVEENHIVDRTDYDKVSAASLLNILLLWANIPNDIPSHFHELISFAAAYNLKSGPQAITYVRNCIVHPHLKNREKYKQISVQVKQQVLRIGIYYTELLMLKYFNYNGLYDSRFSTGNIAERVLVPWA